MEYKDRKAEIAKVLAEAAWNAHRSEDNSLRWEYLSEASKAQHSEDEQFRAAKVLELLAKACHETAKAIALHSLDEDGKDFDLKELKQQLGYIEKQS
jgi:hypothetical protein